MLFDFAVCRAPVSQEGVLLDTIFYVDGDGTYATPRKPVTEGKTYFVYTLRGEGLISHDGGVFSAAAGTFLFLRPRRDFSYRCRDGKWEFWWFEFTGGCPYPVDKPFPLPVSPFAAALMQKSLEFAKLNAWDVSAALFLSLLKMLWHSASQPEGMGTDERVIARAMEYIRDNLDTVTVQELSEALGVGERTLRNLFTRVAGLPPKGVIMKTRMEYAGQLLLSTTLPLDEIARQLGFSSRYHFSKAFKAHYQVTPIRYRKWIQMW